MSGPQTKPVLTGVSYGDNYITLEFKQPDGTPDSFTLGLGVTRFPYRLTLYGRDFFEEDAGYMDVFFRFADEAGDLWSLTLACPVAEVDEITDGLSTYFVAFRKRHSPKSDADPSSQSDEAEETATAPSPTTFTPSLTSPLPAENEHAPADKADPKFEAALVPCTFEQAA